MGNFINNSIIENGQTEFLKEIEDTKNYIILKLNFMLNEFEKLENDITAKLYIGIQFQELLKLIKEAKEYLIYNGEIKLKILELKEKYENYFKNFNIDKSYYL
jgi:DNA primase large subunit